MKDRLFLLPATGFENPALEDDLGRGWFCPPCAMVEGFLAAFPHVREQLEVAYVPFPRPRRPVVDLVGEAHQGLPLLILAEPAEGEGIETAGGLTFISDEKAILRYLGRRYGAAQPLP
ncbi:DUF3088 family protein [Caulobacter mirabilis]|uniref:DUF3088 family protein n=1 Tax=Caulobacter mirabilis TaxID=69666 RepID=UPI001FE6B5CB|nr:DUF3088 family protein [Caulobacter mirabilis]